MMKNILATLLLIFHNAGYVRPNPALALLQVAWDKVNPGSVTNRIKEISKELGNIKTSIVKSEFAAIYGDDIKTLEYLVDKYASFTESDTRQKEEWAETVFDAMRVKASRLLPGDCNCADEGVFYTEASYFFKEPKTANVTDSEHCQISCQDDKECKVWTFFISNASETSGCFLHRSDKHRLYDGPNSKRTILSGPKFCKPTNWALILGISIPVGVIALCCLCRCCCKWCKKKNYL